MNKKLLRKLLVALCVTFGLSTQAQGLTDAFGDAAASNTNLTHLNVDDANYKATTSIIDGELKFEFDYKSGTTGGFNVFVYDLPSALDLSGTGNTFSFRIKSTKQFPLYLQFQEDNGSGGFSQVQAVFASNITYTADGTWQTVTAPIGNIANYDAITRLRIGINTAGTNTGNFIAEDGVAYLDNFVLGDGATAIGPAPAFLTSTGLTDNLNDATASNAVISHASSSMLSSSTFDDSGNGVLKFNYTSGTGGSFERARYTAPKNASGGYFDLSAGATVSMRVKSALAYPILIQAVDKDNNISSANGMSSFTADNTWQTITGTIASFAGVDDTAIDRIRIYVNGNNNIPTTGELLIDDVVIGDGSYAVNATNVWDGSASTDWASIFNWSLDAVPTSLKDVTIPAGLTNYPTIATGTSVSVNSLTIESGATLIADGTSTVTGNVTYKRNLSFTTGNAEGWHLVGAPVAGQTYNDTFVSANSIASGTGSNRGIATYDNSVASSNWSYLQSGGSGTFETGKGYSVKTSQTADVSFTGTLNTDAVAEPITVGAGTPFNLISNPYTAFINSGSFLTSNTALLTSETLWVWNPSTKNYDAKISGEAFKVAPGQAFFVSSGSAGDVTFTENIQSHESTDTFLKAEPKPEITLNITDGSLNRYAKIYYNNNATKSFDNGLDGERFGGVTTTLDAYTQLLAGNVGKNYQVQSLPNTDLQSMVIPVGVIGSSGKEIVFTANASNLPEDLNVYLEDRDLNTFMRLDEANANYTVTLTQALNGIGRFYLHTKSSSALSVSNALLENVSIYKSSKTKLTVTGIEPGQATVKIFNILGKQMINTSFNSNGVKEIALPNLATGVYIVQLATVKGKLNKKIVLE